MSFSFTLSPVWCNTWNIASSKTHFGPSPIIDYKAPDETAFFSSSSLLFIHSLQYNWSWSFHKQTKLLEHRPAKYFGRAPRQERFQTRKCSFRPCHSFSFTRFDKLTDIDVATRKPSVTALVPWESTSTAKVPDEKGFFSSSSLLFIHSLRQINRRWSCYTQTERYSAAR